MFLRPTDWTMVATSWQQSEQDGELLSAQQTHQNNRSQRHTHTPAICHKGQHLDTGVLDLR